MHISLQNAYLFTHACQDSGCFFLGSEYVHLFTLACQEVAARFCFVLVLRMYTSLLLLARIVAGFRKPGNTVLSPVFSLVKLVHCLLFARTS